MLPLMLTAAPVQTGEVVAPEAPPVVLEGRGVEVPAGVEPAPEEPVAEEEEPPVALVEVTEAEEEPEPVAVAELLALELSVAEAEEVLEVLVVEPAEVVVSIGGTEMGWPAEEHWATTALETADRIVSIHVLGLDGRLIGRGKEDIQIWSETGQAFWTQGVMSPTSWGFWQWQAKSVRDEQPSVVRAVTKQLSWREQSISLIRTMVWYDTNIMYHLLWSYHTEQLGTSGS